MKNKEILNGRIGLKLVAIGKMSKIFALQRFSDEDHEITPEQFSVLAALAEHGAMHQSQIGGATMKDKANITRIVNILETNGLVRRNIEADKRRVNKIYMTERGQLAYTKILPTILGIWKDTVKGISKHEMDILLKVLSKIRTNLEDELNIKDR